MLEKENNTTEAAVYERYKEAARRIIQEANKEGQINIDMAAADRLTRYWVIRDRQNRDING